MTLSNIANAVSGRFFGNENDKNTEITGAVLDSRNIEPGYLFFATRGERVDGHSFIGQVFQKGACCVICEEPPVFNEETDDICYASKKPYILVENSFQALKDLAEFYRNQLSIPIVGITGSVGKTSTKEAVAAVLSAKYNVLKTAGNFNNEVGLPLTILSIKEEHEVAVVEMGISDFGEMDRLSKIAKPDVCVITNIGFCHLENLKTQDGIFKAKTEMFNHRNKEGSIILNGDDPFLSKIEDVDGTKPVFFGYKEGLDMRIQDIELQGILGSNFTLKSTEGHLLPCHSNHPGSHVIINAACAALVGLQLGLSAGEIKQGIVAQKALPGRSNIIDTGEKIIIDDCYNANPVSMREAIDLLKLADGRKVAILGDMFELGEDEVCMHYEVGKYVAENNIDILLCAGALSKNMLEGALVVDDSKMILSNWYETRDELINDLKNIINKGDSILVKASHGMHYEEIVKILC